jgi:hypothetical protein
MQYLEAVAGLGWKRAAPVDRTCGTRVREAGPEEAVASLAFAPARGLSADTRVRAMQAAPADAGTEIGQGHAEENESAVRVQTADLPPLDATARVRWQPLPARDAAMRLRWRSLPGTDQAILQQWHARLPNQSRRRVEFPPYTRPGVQSGAWDHAYERPQGGQIIVEHATAPRPHNYRIRIRHQRDYTSTLSIGAVAIAHRAEAPPLSWLRSAYDAVAVAHGRPVHRPPPVQAGSTGDRVRWREAGIVDTPLRIRWGPVRFVAYSPPVDSSWQSGGTGRVIIPRRTLYMILYDLSVVRLPDRAPLPWIGFSLRTDAGSWGWSMSLALSGHDAAGMIQPSGNDPVQIEIGLNGRTWIMLCEDWTDHAVHGSRSVTVRGRSLAALLSDRYERPRDYTETADRTLVQLAEQELPAGGGWSLVWEPVSWSVPAGAWTYGQLSPVQAIARLAEASGGMLVGAPDSQTLTVRPVYGILPWNLSSGQEDLLVPESAVQSVDRRYRYPDQANAVHLAGGEVGGVQARIYRSGSAGDEYTAARTEALLTHIDGAIALGSRLLAGAATPPGISSFEMAVDPSGDFAVPTLGDLIRVDMDGGQMGPCTGISITVAGGQNGGVTVRQSLAIGESTNSYRRLLQLVPQDPLILAQIAAVHGDGTLTCTTATAGSLRVRGAGSVGDWVWIRSGRVESAAPDLPAYDAAV